MQSMPKQIHHRTSRVNRKLTILRGRVSDEAKEKAEEYGTVKEKETNELLGKPLGPR